MGSGLRRGQGALLEQQIAPSQIISVSIFCRFGNAQAQPASQGRDRIVTPELPLYNNSRIIHCVTSKGCGIYKKWLHAKYSTNKFKSSPSHERLLTRTTRWNRYVFGAMLDLVVRPRIRVSVKLCHSLVGQDGNDGGTSITRLKC